MDRDEGVGATIVSNLRFNVRFAYSRGNERLMLRLLPRSRKRWVRVEDIKEMSVRLAGVRVGVLMGRLRFWLWRGRRLLMLFRRINLLRVKLA